MNRIQKIEAVIRNLPMILLMVLSVSYARADLTNIETALESGESDQAIAMIEALGGEAQSPEAQLLLGRAYVQTNRFDEAYDVLSDVVETLPENAEAYYWHGAAAGSLAANVSMFKAGKYAKIVRKAFGRAIELDPKHIEAHIGLIQFHLQAPRIVGGKKKEAERLARNVVELEPLRGTLILANVFQQTKRQDEAQSLLNDFSRANPDEPRIWLQLGFIAQNDEDWSRAHETFSKGATAGDERNEHTEARLGALYQIGRTAVFANSNQDAGIKAFEEYLAADLPDGLPGKDWANYRMGVLLESQGDTEAANTAYVTARSITEDDNLIEQLARKL